jgi:hypothetical protein
MHVMFFHALYKGGKMQELAHFWNAILKLVLCGELPRFVLRMYLLATHIWY